MATYNPKTAPLLYVNTVWMRKYRGHSARDPVFQGHFGWFKKSGNTAADAHDQFNFLPIGNRVYAYVPGSPVPNITRLGANRRDTEISGVLVAFMARDPLDGATRIVGCYHDATVNRAMEYVHMRRGFEVQSPITALAANAKVLPVGERSVIVPHWRQARADGGEQSGYGQSPLWYGDEDDTDSQVRDLLIRAWKANGPYAIKVRTPRPTGSPRQSDTAMRLAVEAAAMEQAKKYFGTDRDVSAACLGWDLEAEGVDGDILIEVKGLSGPQVNFELTPNEYDKMQKHRDRYVVFVLTDALGTDPRISVFRYRNPRGAKKWGQGGWYSGTGDALKLSEAVSARCSAGSVPR